jgi:hypothetical protein
LFFLRRDIHQVISLRWKRQATLDIVPPHKRNTTSFAAGLDSFLPLRLTRNASVHFCWQKFRPGFCGATAILIWQIR